MSTAETKPETKSGPARGGIRSVGGGVKLPKALTSGDLMAVVEDVLKRAMDLLDADDRDKQIDAITDRPRTSARNFIKACVNAAPAAGNDEDE